MKDHRRSTKDTAPILKHTLVIPGFHAVRESLLNRKEKIDEIWIEEGKKGPRVDELLRLAKGRSLQVSFKSREDLDRLSPGTAHQGLAALTGSFLYAAPEEIIHRALQARGFGLILAADHITDEGNLGSLMRTAAYYGVHGLILPKDRSAQITGRVLKRTSGAYVHLLVAQVVNLGRTLAGLRDKGFWIVGAAGEGPVSIHDFDWKRHTVLVLGSESRGLSRAARDRCDEFVRIPGKGTVESLNVSVAGGIILAEIMRQQLKGKP
jgi:23S rRNA (guanosine2251-2'-O)-methyltransferase